MEMYVLVVLEARSPRSRCQARASPWLAEDTFSLCPRRRGKWKESPLVSLLKRTLILVDQGPTLWASFILKGLMSKYNHTGNWASTCGFGRYRYSVHNRPTQASRNEQPAVPGPVRGFSRGLLICSWRPCLSLGQLVLFLNP